MALFGSRFKEKEEEKVEVELDKSEEIVKERNLDRVATPTSNTSKLQHGVKIEGNINAKGSLIIGGDFKGKADIEETIFIEHNANFKGELKAKNVKISGNFEGKIDALFVEVTQSAKFKGLINANKTFLAGEVIAIIKSTDSLEVLPTGIVEAKEAKSNNIKILGQIKGRVIASELLEVTSGGSIEGTIVTKGIKTEQGGTIIGNIQTFDEEIHGIDIEYSLEDVFEDEKKGIIENNQLNKLTQENLQKYAKKEKKDSKTN